MGICKHGNDEFIYSCAACSFERSMVNAAKAPIQQPGRRERSHQDAFIEQAAIAAMQVRLLRGHQGTIQDVDEAEALWAELEARRQRR